jgi:hypothetical protein
MGDRFHEYRFTPGARMPAECRDGRRRSAVVTGLADYSTAPASVQITAGGRRRTVSGFLSFRSSTVLEFVGTGRNADLVPWTGHRRRTADLARRLISATAWGFACPGVNWELPSEHAGKLAGGCRHHVETGCPPPWTAGNPVAHEICRKLKRGDHLNLARFYSKLERFLLLAGE